MHWTAEAVAHLKHQWAIGTSCGIIAKQLETTRSAVCGKLHRLGEPLRRLPGRREYGGKRRNTPGMPRVSLAGPSVIVMPVGRPPIEIPIEFHHDNGRRNVDILNIQPHGCRYATTLDTPFRFCNVPAIPGRSWCEEHVGIVYDWSKTATVRANAAAKRQWGKSSLRDAT